LEEREANNQLQTKFLEQYSPLINNLLLPISRVTSPAGACNSGRYFKNFKQEMLKKKPNEDSLSALEDLDDEDEEDVTLKDSSTTHLGGG